jgi:DNA repair protein RadD
VTELRPYQHPMVADYEVAVTTGQKRIIIVLPTGAGKTVVFAEIAKRAVAKYQRVLVISHRREIIQQTVDKLAAADVSCGIILAGCERDLRPMSPVQVASIQTLHARALRSSTMLMPLADLIIIDECHHARARTYQELIEAYPNAILLGATATPVRGDGLGLGNIFSIMVEGPQVAELIEQKYLVKSRVYAPVDPNLKGVETRQGDYVITQLSTRMNTDQLVGGIVEHWHKYGDHRRTVAFAVDVAHSVHIRDEFLKAGVRAEHIDGGTPKPERDAVLARLASGETEVLSNCQVLTEGWDMPAVSCCILARPTKQMGFFRQMIGRVLRPAEGKPDAIILDHSGAVYRHGLPEDHVEWTLDTDRRAVNPTHDKRQREVEHRLHECPACKAIMTVPPCSNCGWMPKPRARDVEVAEGELGLVVGRKASPSSYGPEERSRWHAMLTYIAQERGYQRGWVAHKYKEKFGTWPAWGATVQPIEPTPEILAWVRSRMIAYAKRRSAA